MDQINDYTGLPTKDETSKTNVRNVYCLFHNIHDSLQLKTCLFLCQIISQASRLSFLRSKVSGRFYIVQLILGNPVPFPVQEFLYLKNLRPSNFFQIPKISSPLPPPGSLRKFSYLLSPSQSFKRVEKLLYNHYIFFSFKTSNRF